MGDGIASPNRFNAWTLAANHMKAVILIFIILSFKISFGQHCPTRLITSSRGVANKLNDTVLLISIRRRFFKDSILIKTLSGKRITISENNVWGYEDCEDLYRNYDQEFYKVRQIGSLIIYSKSGLGFRGIASTHYYFSKSLDDKIYSLSWENIKDQFKDNTCFLENIEKKTKWYQDYSSWNKEKKQYQFVIIYDQCKN
jgi:hypothetical protein